MLAQREAEEMRQEQAEWVAQLERAEVNKKARVLGARETIYNATMEEVNKRKLFEQKITRPYFHFSPLDADQLDNWRKYLDFEEKQPGNAVFKLYERCLVPCVR